MYTTTTTTTVHNKRGAVGVGVEGSVKKFCTMRVGMVSAKPVKAEGSGGVGGDDVWNRERDKGGK